MKTINTMRKERLECVESRIMEERQRARRESKKSITFKVIYGRRRKRKDIRCFLKFEFLLYMLKETEMINIRAREGKENVINTTGKKKTRRRGGERFNFKGDKSEEKKQDRGVIYLKEEKDDSNGWQ